MNQQKHTRPFGKFHLYLSISIGIFISVIIGVVVFELLPRTGNSDKEIKEIKNENFGILWQMFRGQEITWDQIGNYGYGIDSANREIAIAKVMMKISTPPEAHTELHSIWENRVELSQKKWKMYKLSDLYIKSVLAGAGSLILTIPGVWLVLGWMISIIQFIWNFILDRITEISDAVKGQRIKADKTK